VLTFGESAVTSQTGVDAPVSNGSSTAMLWTVSAPVFVTTKL